MEAVTKESPFGQFSKKIEIENGQVAIPVYNRIQKFQEDSARREIIAGKTPALLPNIAFNVINEKNGELIKTEEMPSLRRDLLAYTYVCYAINSIINEFLNDDQKKALSELEKQTDERWQQTKNLISSSSDKEAKQVVETWYQTAKNLFSKVR